VLLTCSTISVTARTVGRASILTFANVVPMSLRSAKRLRRNHGIDARVTDLPWLAPLPVWDIVREANATGRVLIVDETRRSGGFGQAVLTAFGRQRLPRRSDPHRQLR
jgi:2-oxoisovalerate dehydrogenase E1 component